MGDAQITSLPGNSIGIISDITKLSYQYGLDVKPEYVIGETVPSRITFGAKQVQISLNTNKTDGLLYISGNRTSLRVSLVHPTDSTIFQNFDCRGIVYDKSISTTSNNILENSLTIKQNNLSEFNLLNQQNTSKPIIYSITPTTGFYGRSITVSGMNLSYVDFVSYGNNIFDYSFDIINDNQLITYAPNGATSGPLTFYTPSTYTVSNQSFIIGGIPINIQQVSPITGNIGDTIQISGSNFYDITNVNFNGQPAIFSVVNSNLIQTIVPQNASWGYINAVSNDFLLTGTSPFQFVPIPTITSFSPVSGFTGSFVNLLGFGFSGITGVEFNNLPPNGTTVFSVINNNEISAQVPSGNTYGLISLFGQSGVYINSLLNFYPYAILTGVSELTGNIGDTIQLSGQNLIPDILYKIGSNSIIVGFQGNATGIFNLFNNDVLIGQVPPGAENGTVSVFSPQAAQYPSQVYFTITTQAPTINYITPQSGQINTTISVVGSNFINVSSVILTGNATGLNLGSNYTVSNTYNVLNFNIPNLTGGLYSIGINTLAGFITGNNLLTVLTNPYISGFIPLSGGLGTQVSLSGLNLYNNLTQVYIDSTGFSAPINTQPNNSQLTFTIPSNIYTGLHNIIVYNSVGSGVATQQFNVLLTPVISGFTPYSGQWGDTIVVSGLYFNNVNSISVGTTPVNSFSIIGTTGIDFTIPVSAQTSKINLITLISTGKSQQQLVVVPPLVQISGFVPNPTYYGSGLLISGNYFDTAQEILFSGVNGIIPISTFTTIGTTGISLTVPNAVISGSIGILNGRGIMYSPQLLTLIPNPVINSINLQTGVFKDFIQISGSGFSGNIVYFGAPTGIVTADNTVIVGDTGITFNVPHEIVNNSLILQGRNNNQINYTGNFTVLPTISGVSGNYTYASGTNIIITGINSYQSNTAFLGISGYNGSLVYYNLLNSSYTQDNTNETGINNLKNGYAVITATLGNNFAGSGKLFLNSIYDTGVLITESLINKVAFNQPIIISQPAPVITSLYPLVGNTLSPITIVGQNLFSTNNVVFSTPASTNATIISQNDNQIIFYPPNVVTGTGLITVNTPFGSASSGVFTLIQKLYISGFVPVSGHSGDLITFSGSGFQGVTAMSFGGYNTSFVGNYLNNTYILSGVVPIQYNCCPQTVNICLYNQGDIVCATGFQILPNFLNWSTTVGTGNGGGTTVINSGTTGVIGISVTGFSAQTGTINFSGAGNIVVQTGSNNFIYFSGNSNLITTSQTGQFYPASNPNNYPTSGNLLSTGQTLYNDIIGLSGLLSGNIQSTGQTLYNLINNYTGYQNTNPSGFITAGSAIAGVNSFNVTGWGLQSGAINISGAGNIVVSTGIGNFIYISGNSNIITTSQTGQFYPYSNPLNFANSGNLNSFITTGSADARYVHLTGNENINGLKVFSGVIFSGQFSGVNLTGYNIVSNTLFSGQQLSLYNPNNTVPLVVITSATQSANMQEWRNAAGAVVASVQSAGQSISLNQTGAAPMVIGSPGLGVFSNYFGGIWVGESSPTISNYSFLGSTSQQLFGAPAGGNIEFRIANNSSLLSIYPSGVGINLGNNIVPFYAFQVNTPTATGVTTAIITPTLSTYKGLVIQGLTAQVANLQEWQNSGGTGLSYVNKDGNIYISGQAVSTGQSSAGGSYYPLNSNPSGYITSGKYYAPTFSGLYTGALITINWASGNVFKYNLTGNNDTFSFAGNVDGQTIVCAICNTGTNNFSGLWPTTVHWPNSIIPVQSMGSTCDIYTFINIFTGIYGSVVQGFSN